MVVGDLKSSILAKNSLQVIMRNTNASLESRMEANRWMLAWKVCDILYVIWRLDDATLLYD